MAKKSLEPSIMKAQPCPICKKPELTLMEAEDDIPFFGKIFLFSMTCGACHYHKADIEAAEKKEPVKFTFEVENQEDLKVRVVKASSATVKIPHLVTIESTEGSNGYITNIEGILKRIQRILEQVRDNEEDPASRKKAKAHLKKVQKALWGQDKIKIIIEDPTGNSAIISEKTEKSKIRK